MGFGNSTGAAEEVNRLGLGITLIKWCHQALLVLRSMVDEQLLCEAIILV
jgi:hypothetical protein